MEELIEPVADASSARKPKARVAGSGAGVGGLRPKRARITGAGL
jgi:hypothetical protein